MSSPAERAEITAVTVLAHHALVEIRCDHDAGQDLPVCNCALVDLGWHPTVRAAKEAWARHVLEVLQGEGLVVLDKQQAETVRSSDAPECALSINRLEFAGHGVKASMTGREIRQLPNPPIPDDHDLFLVVPGHEDELVTDGRVIDVSAYGHSSGRDTNQGGGRTCRHVLTPPAEP